MIKFCKFCGKQFTTEYHRRIYCDDECRNKYYGKPPSESYSKIKVCKFCGTQFSSGYVRQVYCCDNCRLNDYKNLKAEYNKINYVPKYAECKFCGNKFRVTHEHMKYCSTECRKKGSQKKFRNKPVTKKCPICGEDFTAKSRRTPCCGKVCYRRYRTLAQIRYLKKKQAEAKEKEKTHEEEYEKIKSYQKQHSEFLENQKKEYFYNSFSENGSENNNKYTVDDFEFLIIEENNNYSVSVSQFGIKKNYNSKIHSDLFFDNKRDIIDFCYKIYTGAYDYIRDCDLYAFKTYKLTRLKEKIYFNNFMIKLLKKIIIKKDYEQLMQILYAYTCKKLKTNMVPGKTRDVNIVLNKTRIVNIVSYNNNPIELLENYIAGIIYPYC